MNKKIKIACFLMYPLIGYILSLFLIIFCARDNTPWVPFFLSSPLFFISLWVLINVLGVPCCTHEHLIRVFGVHFSLCGEHSGEIPVDDVYSINSIRPLDSMELRENVKKGTTFIVNREELVPSLQGETS